MIKLVLFLALGVAIWWMVRPALARPAPPSEARARAILGVNEAADVETVRAAHRRLIASVHPDRGGSAELTRQINDARDVLLRRLGG